MARTTEVLPALSPAPEVEDALWPPPACAWRGTKSARAVKTRAGNRYFFIMILLA
jgi:hypothetical protein